MTARRPSSPATIGPPVAESGRVSPVRVPAAASPTVSGEAVGLAGSRPGALAAARKSSASVPGSTLGGLDLLASKISEAYLDSQIRAITDDLGLLRYHVHDSRRSAAGFPDLVIVGRGVMYRELKREREKLKPAQQQWLERLAAAGQDVGVWRPSHLLSGQIARELAALAGVTS